MCWLCAYPFIERLILCDLVPCLLCRGCWCLREELCTPNLYLPNPQQWFPVWEVLCGRIIEILLCEGRHVELGARTSKHIFVFAFNPLSLNSLSYILHCIILFISYICLVLIVCLTYVEPRELYIAPQLLFKGI